MHAEIIAPSELDEGLLDTWRSFQRATSALASPYFAPEFTQAVGAARSDARVAVLSRDGARVGFLPFHQARRGVAKPIGGQISDYHGVIHAPATALGDAPLNGRDILRAAGLSAYDFNHLPVSQTAFAAGAHAEAVSPFLDLSNGFEAYVAALPKAGKHAVKETARRVRKMTREVGDMRFVRQDDDPKAWHGLLAMKADACRRKGSKFVLEIPWVAETVDRLRSHQSAEFAGLLSTVYAGDRLAAAHFGLRSALARAPEVPTGASVSGGVWHWWFNSFDTDMRAYAPGLMNIIEAAKIAGDEGVDILDFGRGDQAYKQMLCSACAPLLEGSLERAITLPGGLRRLEKIGVRGAEALAQATRRGGQAGLLARKALRKIAGSSVHLPAEA